MSMLRDLLLGIDRPVATELNLRSDQRVADLRTEIGHIGLRLKPTRRAARVNFLALETMGIIRDDAIDNEAQARSFLARATLPGRTVTDLPIFFTPSDETQRLYIAHLQIDVVVLDLSTVNMLVHSPASADVEYVPVNKSIKRRIEESYGITPTQHG